MPSEAAQVIISIIPIVGIVMGCVVIFFYMFWNYKHKKLLIERNLYKKTEFDLDSFSLFSGLGFPRCRRKASTAKAAFLPEATASTTEVAP